MQRVERRARIGASPETVFDYLSDLGNLPDWQTGIVSAERSSPGEMGVGATARVVREVMGQRVEAPLTVTAYDRPHHLAIGSEVSGVKALAQLDLAPAASGGTDLAFAMELRASGLTSFMEPMIARAAGSDIDASLVRLEQRFSNPR